VIGRGSNVESRKLKTEFTEFSELKILLLQKQKGLRLNAALE